MEGVIDLVESSSQDEEVIDVSDSPSTNTFAGSSRVAPDEVADEDDDVVLVGSSRSAEDDDDDVVEVGASELSEHAKAKMLEKLLAERQQLKREVESLSTKVRIGNKADEPAYWRRDGQGRKLEFDDEFSQEKYRLIELDLCSSEAESILRRFRETGLSWARVSSVSRCRNPRLWEEYSQCRAKMSGKYADDAGAAVARPHDTLPGLEAEDTNGPFSVAPDAACERYLFHGASPKTVDSILEAGIDFRLSLSSGAMGACAYFADQASYSHNYCAMREHSNESDGYGRNGGIALMHTRATPDTFKMLVCRVLLGNCARGHSGLRRPPPISPHSTELFDSVSDGPLQAPNYASRGCMFGVFDNAQVYPEYVVCYTAPDHHRHQAISRQQHPGLPGFPNHLNGLTGGNGANAWAATFAALVMGKPRQQQQQQQQQQQFTTTTRRAAQANAAAAATHMKAQSALAAATTAANENKRPARRQSNRNKRKRVKV